MPVVPVVPAAWLVWLINEFGTEPRRAAGQAESPYPNVGPDAPGPAKVASDAELAKLADSLWPVFSEPTPAHKASTLNILLETANVTPLIGEQGDLCWFTPDSPAPHTLHAGCVAALLHAVQQTGWRRLAVCDGADCADVHLNQTGGQRRYCSPTCLNRARVRAFRHRQRQ
jgi:hypothetical protein